jgi:hypothetical protein
MKEQAYTAGFITGQPGSRTGNVQMHANVQQRRSVKEEIKSKMKTLSWVRRRVEKLQVRIR